MSKPQQKTIGKKIQRARKDLELTQADLAGIFDVAPVTVSRWENDSSPPQAPGAILLALECLQMKRVLDGSEIIRAINQRVAEVEKMRRRLERDREAVERSLK
jgi:transcriptional regulator with XRE-family HTH domain